MPRPPPGPDEAALWAADLVCGALAANLGYGETRYVARLGDKLTVHKV